MLWMVFPLVGLMSSFMGGCSDTVYLGFLSIPFGLVFVSDSGVVEVVAFAVALAFDLFT